MLSKLLTLTLVFPFFLIAQEHKIVSIKTAKASALIDNVQYSFGSQYLYNEYNDGSEVFSSVVGIDATLTVSLTWTNLNPTNKYAVYSSPSFDDWRTPWVRTSPWLMGTTNLTWTQSFMDEQRFFKIVKQ